MCAYIYSYIHLSLCIYPNFLIFINIHIDKFKEKKKKVKDERKYEVE